MFTFFVFKETESSLVREQRRIYTPTEAELLIFAILIWQQKWKHI